MEKEEEEEEEEEEAQPKTDKWLNIDDLRKSRGLHSVSACGCSAE